MAKTVESIIFSHGYIYERGTDRGQRLKEHLPARVTHTYLPFFFVTPLIFIIATTNCDPKMYSFRPIYECTSSINYYRVENCPFLLHRRLSLLYRCTRGEWHVTSLVRPCLFVFTFIKSRFKTHRFTWLVIITPDIKDQVSSFYSAVFILCIYSVPNRRHYSVKNISTANARRTNVSPAPVRYSFVAGKGYNDDIGRARNKHVRRPRRTNAD